MRAQILLLLVVSCSSCGESSGPTVGVGYTGPSSGVSLTGQAQLLRIPSHVTPPVFANLSIDFMAMNAFASAQNLSLLGAGNMASAAPSCAESGCAWQARAISLGDGQAGLAGLVRDTRGDSAAVWQDTVSYLVNPNQVQIASRLNTAITAFGPAFVLPKTAITSWADALGTDSKTLVARGLCLGFVWHEKSAQAGTRPSVTGASVNPARADVTRYYPNDAYTAFTNKVTNVDGAFLLVGPEKPADSQTFTVDVTLSAPGVQKNYIAPYAVVRPGYVTVMPILPQL